MTPDPVPGSGPPASVAGTTSSEAHTPLAEPVPTDTAPRTVTKTRTASSYVFLVTGALVTLGLVIFIIQNLSASPEVKFFGWGYRLPIGINMLISALAGAIITGLVGALRIAQLRRAYRRG